MAEFNRNAFHANRAMGISFKMKDCINSQKHPPMLSKIRESQRIVRLPLARRALHSTTAWNLPKFTNNENRINFSNTRVVLRSINRLLSYVSFLRSLERRYAPVDLTFR